MATVQYHGSLGKIYGIWLSNLLLTIVTLGIYGFWGRKRIRQYLASQVTLNGDPMEYQGTVAEHVIGTIKFVGVILALYMLFGAIFPLPQPDIETMKKWQETSPQLLLEDGKFKEHFANEFIYGTLENIFYIFFMGLFIFTSRCYRINRVSWQGIYHRLDGSMWQYAFLRLYVLLGKFFTLGLLAPQLDTKWASWTYSRLFFGNQPAHLLPYSPSKELKRTNLITILLILGFTLIPLIFPAVFLYFFSSYKVVGALLLYPFIFLVRLYYHAAFYREFLGHITVAGVLVDSSRITGSRLASLIFGNVALQVFTLGLAQPVVIDRTLRWLTENITFDGELANDIGSSPRLSLSSEMPPFFIA
jgi:uncharacterized membrane protein YjgN (DUF898 family)